MKLKIETEPTKEEFEAKYNVTIPDKAFQFLKTFLWEICCAKDTKQFYKAIKADTVQELVDYCENK